MLRGLNFTDRPLQAGGQLLARGMAASAQPQPLSITLLQTLNTSAKAFMGGPGASAGGAAGGPGPGTAAVGQLGF